MIKLSCIAATLVGALVFVPAYAFTLQDAGLPMTAVPSDTSTP